jgi:hypothetical protein
MAVTVEMQNTGDSRVGREILVVVEHLRGDRPGEWRVLIDLPVTKCPSAEWTVSMSRRGGVNLEIERTVTVKNDEIPGFMSAMTMPYEVAKAKDLDKVSLGDEVRADAVLNEGRVRLEKITIVKRSTGQ